MALQDLKDERETEVRLADLLTVRPPLTRPTHSLFLGISQLRKLETRLKDRKAAIKREQMVGYGKKNDEPPVLEETTNADKGNLVAEVGQILPLSLDLNELTIKNIVIEALETSTCANSPKIASRPSGEQRPTSGQTESGQSFQVCILAKSQTFPFDVIHFFIFAFDTEEEGRGRGDGSGSNAPRPYRWRWGWRGRI